MAVRRPAPWMQAIDDRLLEFLDQEGVGTPKSINDEWVFDFHRETIGRRLRLLSKIKMIEKVGRGVYRITPKGREYLSGEADLRDEEKPD